MLEKIFKVAFGGGCHWCTEAVFQSLIGVEKVEQGYVSSTEQNNALSEAVIVHYNRKCITLQTLIEIHLLTHQSTSNHAMREKYRSAIYVFSSFQHDVVIELLSIFQKIYKGKLITPEKAFCETYIKPKLKLLLQQFGRFVDYDKVRHLDK